jgi:rubrerythrin
LLKDVASDRRRHVAEIDDDIIRGLSTAKALAIAAYGESVAAYRYRTLSRKAPTEAHRSTFLEMAEEEQGHHKVVQDLLDKEHPGASFVLSLEDKALVIVGPRLLELSGPGAFTEAMQCIYESECLTGSFYAKFRDATDRRDLKQLLHAMAEECFAHAERLKAIPGTDQ